MKKEEQQRLVVGQPVTGSASAVNGVPLYGEHPEGSSSRFVVQGYRDVWAAVLFLGSLVAMMARAGYALGNHEVVLHTRNADTNLFGTTAKTAVLYVGISGIGAIVLSLLSMAIMHQNAAMYIKGGNLIVIALQLFVGGILMTQGDMIFLGVMFLLFGLFHAFWFYLARKRIPLASLLLRNSTEIIFSYMSTVSLSLYSVFVNHLNYLLTGVVLLSFCEWVQDAPTTPSPTSEMFAKHHNATTTPSPTTSGGDTYLQIRDNAVGYFLLALLFLYWFNQVILNVVHVTVSGLAATTYFLHGSMPTNPTLKSFRRAMTTSFGSICFGSLIVAILQLLHTLAKGIARNRRSFVALCAYCLVLCLERLVQYFNIYAFTYVAIYGDSFLGGAKKAWNLLTTATCATIFNDALVYSALNVTAAFIGIDIGLVAYFISRNVVIGVACGIWSVVLAFLVLRVLRVNVVTLFVCVAEAPEALRDTNPILHAEIAAAIDLANTSAA